MFKKNFFSALSLVALFHSIAPAFAEDIDLYSGLSGAAGIPNVLIVIDNAANFDANSTGTCSYSDAPSTTVNMAGKLAGLEQCALNNVIDALPTNADGSAKVNIGMMVYDATGIASAFPTKGCIATNNGGCLIQELVPMTSANKTSLKALIKSWTIGNIKANGEGTGLAMQEAWAYYAGRTGASGRDYSGIQPSQGCQKNFVIFLGNAYNNVGTPGDGGSSSPSGLLTTAGATTDQKKSISISYAHGLACNTSNPYYSMPNHTDSSGLWADEWTRFMHDTDIYGNLDGTQNITTYTIGALGTACKADYPALLTSMANNGGGKYFAVSADAATDIVQAFLKILNEVQAVNSVFASSSLPVSVNTQGTFLNQVFIGMFRPDASGNPRWLGNLKQYQFLLDSSTGTVSLGDSYKHCADSQGNANSAYCSAISSAGTGFISPNAISYWTCGGNPSLRTCSPVSDPTGGFWINNPQSAGGAYDLPDGELVEKGGAAQVLRLANLQNSYSTTSTTSTSDTRKLYTYCPSGSSCNANLTNSANVFKATNSSIAVTSFGSTSSATISSITLTDATTGTATVTTSGVHGFSAGTSVTIAGSSPTAYNGTFTIVSVPTTKTFTISGITVTPPTPATANTYQATSASSSGVTISSMSRTTSGTSTETVTVNTATNHGFATGDSITITGVSPSRYNGTYTITVPNGASGNSKFTFTISIIPPTPATGTYAITKSTTSSVTITALSCSVSGNGSNKKATVSATTSSAHGFVANDYITIAGATTGYNGSYNLASASGSAFTYVVSSGSSASCPSTATTFGTATPGATQQTITSLTRSGTTDTATATATIGTANRFATGDTVNIVQLTAGTNETAYVLNSVSITCATTACTSFTYPITVSPSTTISTTSATAAPANVSPVNISTLTRSGTTATAVLSGPLNVSSSSSVNILTQTGLTTPVNEAAYIGTFTVTCTVPGASSNACTTFTYTVSVSPGSSSTGTASAIIAPDKATLINWVRGEDNYGDETASPGSPITVRPSIHGDVLHSRPVVINYGGTTGVVAYYGANDGVFHAVNANQTNPTGSTLSVPGSELWGFIPTEFYGKLNRQRTNSPQLSLPSTPSGIVPTPQTKDYFADGSTGVYQEVTSSGTTTKAEIFLTMRRGGKFIYALNVLDPTSPQFLWKISNTTTGFSELGQTWSRPKTAKVKGYANTVLIFGAGYDTAEDSEPPTTDSVGRGIYIVDADTGALVWSATHQPTSGQATSCSGTTTQAACLVSGMDYSIPSDISLVDIDSDGKIDRLYVGDTGGNVWRVDLEPTAGNTPDKWQVTQLAALGCSTGVCASGTPKKFFYPPDVVPASGYDAVMIGSGDREHPLLSSAASSVTNRLYALSDLNTGKDGSSLTTPITEAKLFNATSATYAGVLSDNVTAASGFYITLASGEKVVNAPATVAGQTFFGTNQPTAPSTNSCDTNLGIARGYIISPFTGNGQFSIFTGGGLPPSPVYGVVEIKGTDSNGNETTTKVPFCIGCGGTGSTIAADNGGYTGGCVGDATLCASMGGGGGGGGGNPKCGNISSLEACKAIINASTDRHRTYWYIERDQ